MLAAPHSPPAAPQAPPRTETETFEIVDPGAPRLQTIQSGVVLSNRPDTPNGVAHGDYGDVTDRGTHGVTPRLGHASGDYAS